MNQPLPQTFTELSMRLQRQIFPQEIKIPAQEHIRVCRYKNVTPEPENGLQNTQLLWMRQKNSSSIGRRRKGKTIVTKICIL